ncbi:response regulator [Sphingobacterium sp.]|uniref:response regulator n=1 Tax=Sphingobacterium sp. TaxID=341027 RepID=UPI0028A89760|nr:response regulator [Sphingobacterium sp.]
MKETLRITLVDDDSIFCFLFKKFLEKYDKKQIELSVFPDGYTAAEFFRKNKSNKESYPHVLFIDINMPLMNGWELMTSIKEENLFEDQEVSIYIISSSICKSDRYKTNNGHQYIEYLTKPISHQTLFQVLDSLQS